jgi:hypothetical protein
MVTVWLDVPLLHALMNEGLRVVVAAAGAARMVLVVADVKLVTCSPLPMFAPDEVVNST